MGSSVEGREDARGPGGDRRLVQDEVGERSEDGNCGGQAPRVHEAFRTAEGGPPAIVDAERADVGVSSVIGDPVLEGESGIVVGGLGEAPDYLESPNVGVDAVDERIRAVMLHARAQEYLTTASYTANRIGLTVAKGGEARLALAAGRWEFPNGSPAISADEAEVKRVQDELSVRVPRSSLSISGSIGRPELPSATAGGDQGFVDEVRVNVELVADAGVRQPHLLLEVSTKRG
eukprot:15671033-Heterocapsa_arctica.AAC.1